MKKSLPFIIILTVLVIVVGVTFALWKRGDGTNSNSALTTTNTAPAPVAAGTAPAASNAGATKPNVKVSSPVVLEEFGDYQCPPCGQLYPELKQIEKEYAGQVQIVFHHFPLIKIHKNALLAARAAEAARNQNKFWEMHDLLYENQREWAELADAQPVFLSYAKKLNLNLDKFTQDLTSNVIDQKISADIQRGETMGVTGTPTVFLDRQLLNFQATNLEGMRRGINILLERKAGS